MKNILVTLAFLFVASFSFAQETLGVDTTYVKPKFNLETPKSTELYLYGLNYSFRAADLMDETIELTERLDVYRKKRNRRRITGGILIGAGVAGLWTVAEMDEPIYLTGDSNDPDLIQNNKEADDQKMKRKYVAWPSALIAGVGGILIVDSFKFDKWTKLELGLANVKLTQELYGLSFSKRKYFTDKEEKLIKKKSLYRNSFPRYRK